MNRLVVIAWFLFLCPSAFATSSVNGGFETGNLTGWSGMGDVLVQGTVFGVPPAEGPHQAVITNSPATRYGLASELLQPTSGTPSVGISNNFASFFGTPWNGLGGNWFQLGSFSGIETTFQANSGDQLSFRWNLLFNLYPYPGIFVLDGSASCLGRAGCQQSVNGQDTWQFFNNPGFSQTYDWQSGYQLLNLPIPTTGLHSLGFAALNHQDQEGATALLIDAVSVNPIPEPTTLLLLGSGLAGLSGIAWRRNRRG